MECLVANGSVENPAASYAPVTLACVAPLVSLPFCDAASDEVLDPRPWLLPRLPDAHTQAAAEPLVNGRDLADHVGEIKVFRPASEVVPKGGLALLIAHAVAP